jgi:hypothetical protein
MSHKSGISFTQAAMASLLTAASAVSVHADVVTDWNATAATVIVTNGGGSPPSSGIDVAYVHAVIYDAVNAIDGGYSVYAVSPPSASSNASPEAAAATAAHRVLLALYPSQQAFLDGKYAISLASVAEGDAKQQGIAIGEEVASAFLVLRSGDGRFAPVTYVAGSGAGAWQPTPPAFAPGLTPWVGRMRPFAMSSAAQYRSEPPPALDSKEWSEAYDETRIMGAANSTVRTTEQTEIGRFFIEHPGVQYGRILREFVTEREMSVPDNARFFAMMYLSLADAIISVWEAKYYYGFWRPVTAIRAGDTDGNADTAADSSWSPLAPTPPHPEYPAGHGGFTGAFAATLENFFGTKDVTITLSSLSSGTRRTFHRTDDLVKEVIDGRVFGGMHYRFSVVHGANQGRKAARNVARLYFQPAH